MESSVSSGSDRGIHVRATLVHEQSAARHEAAAAMWEVRGEAEWAELERRCAELEFKSAQLEADRIRLMRLHAGSLKQDDEITRAEAERLRSDIKRRAAHLKDVDDELEHDRERLRGGDQRGGEATAAGVERRRARADLRRA